MHKMEGNLVEYYINDLTNNSHPKIIMIKLIKFLKPNGQSFP